ncbi:MAG TPA: hypothetical protein VK877_01305, partial [Pseudolabrys sp.]|nr:hypothetical protein [Pseudolabrys sp.]
MLRELWKNELQFEEICGAIETGRSEWLEVARLLRPVSDGAQTLSVNYSVARALPKAPSRVLRLIGQGFAVEDVCTSPFIEPEPGLAERYEEDALRALAGLSGSR